MRRSLIAPLPMRADFAAGLFKPVATLGAGEHIATRVKLRGIGGGFAERPEQSGRSQNRKVMLPKIEQRGGLWDIEPRRQSPAVQECEAISRRERI